MNSDEVRELLLGIAQGKIGLRKSLLPEQDTLEVHYGVVQFTTDSGWVLDIFFDCGGWDYIDCVTDPDGASIQYGDLPLDLKHYRPPRGIRREIYKSPGYLGIFLDNES